MQCQIQNRSLYAQLVYKIRLASRPCNLRTLNPMPSLVCHQNRASIQSTIQIPSMARRSNAILLLCRVLSIEFYTAVFLQMDFPALK